LHKSALKPLKSFGRVTLCAGWECGLAGSPRAVKSKHPARI
jgi:hypothetical protein